VKRALWILLVASPVAAAPSYVTYCPACGDKAPSEPMPHLPTAYDASTTYIQVSPYRYANMAALAGSPPANAPPSLRVQGETPNGVLILPDDEPVTQQGPRTSDLGPRLIVLPEVRSPMPEAPSLWPWIGGGTAGALGSLVTVMMVARRKRHRAQLPRALGLVERR
jgi:hypothetical protein